MNEPSITQAIAEAFAELAQAVDQAGRQERRGCLEPNTRETKRQRQERVRMRIALNGGLPATLIDLNNGE